MSKAETQGMSTAEYRQSPDDLHVKSRCSNCGDTAPCASWNLDRSLFVKLCNRCLANALTLLQRYAVGT